MLRKRELVVTSNENHWINISFNIIEIFQKCKIFEYHWIQKFSNNADLRKQDFLSLEKISYHFRFVNKDVLQSWFNKKLFIVIFKNESALKNSFSSIVGVMSRRVSLLHFTLPLQIPYHKQEDQSTFPPTLFQNPPRFIAQIAIWD